MLSVIALPISGCDLAEKHLRPDRYGELEMQDYKDGLAPRVHETEEKTSGSFVSSIPALQPYISAASSNLKPMPLVSISVNQTVPLRDVLFELASQAGYDVEMDPNITGAIIFVVRNKPFDLVIERVCELAALRCTFEENVLRAQVDTPYNETYKISYLSFIRKNAGSVKNSVGLSSEGANSGSKYESSIKSESDFWGELETNLEQILAISLNVLRTSTDPKISALAQEPNVQAIGIQRDGVTVQPPNATIQVRSLPSASSTSGEDTEPKQATYSINKQAGLVNIYATSQTHKQVKEYLKLLKKSVTAQVLIEAKILEVTLSDQFQAGIDWRFIGPFSGDGVLGYNGLDLGFSLFDVITGDFDPLVPGAGPSLPTNNNFVIGHAGNDFQALVQALSTFGTTRALASPRVTVINNQSAVLNVATNRVYFELAVETITDDGDTNITVTSDQKSVPEGVLVNVQPSIDLDNNTISLVVRPTVTRISGSVADPAVAFAVAEIGVAAAGIESLIPEVNVQEIDSVVQMRSGQAIVMGGLLQDNFTGTQTSVPVLGELPVFGGLFRNTNDIMSKTELVIFLKATIIESPEDSVHNTDRDIYRKFSQDRRPFKL